MQQGRMNHACCVGLDCSWAFCPNLQPFTYRQLKQYQETKINKIRLFALHLIASVLKSHTHHPELHQPIEQKQTTISLIICKYYTHTNTLSYGTLLAVDLR